MSGQDTRSAACSRCGYPRTRTACARCLYVELEDRDPRYDDMDAPSAATLRRATESFWRWLYSGGKARTGNPPSKFRVPRV